jgi:uncharacterized phage protein (TIGR01671 family)
MGLYEMMKKFILRRYKMREIKFRGKRIDTGEWVYGHYLKSASTFIAVDGGLVDGHFELYEVDPETVGQFTNCYDKNGKEIWEGDVIQYQRIKTWGFHCAGGEHKDDTPQAFKGVVSFDDGAFRITENFEYPGVKNLSNICTRWKEEFKKCVLDHQEIHQERFGGYDNAFYEGFEIIGTIHDQKAEV